MKAKYLPIVQQYAKQYDQYGINGPSGYGPFLHISGDQELHDLRFVSELGITHLDLYSCQNAHALRAHTNLRAYAHYGSALKTTKGVERLVGLEFLCLGENQIVELNIRGLHKLKNLWVKTYCLVRYHEVLHFQFSHYQ
ncbi:Hypothetical_protein [Hexamita inflata]|uniref:Hypothetical_protein n=1 Tax=Hexamita inflata TaxID=28002 RepID=A0AA86THL9_9EUKA|nr:Hypothetical protein HINF_LOCUS5131 [Hexamita inflata]